MVDIQCHILPEVDDGAGSFTESLLMARQAEKEGVRTIIATPHHKNGKYNNLKANIIEKTAELNDYLKAENVHMEILPGQETRIYSDILADYEAGEIMTLANISTYLLIELPSDHLPHYLHQLCFDIQMKGLTPVVVHPERNSEIMEQPDKLYRLVKNGVATLITAASFTGYHGKKAQRFTSHLIESNLTHFIASDAHDRNKRGFKMGEAYELVKKKYGTDSLNYFMDNAKLILEGKDIHREAPQRIKKKILGLF
ncbi:tyrosine-protein phosphatase [Lederbergia lenta]|uniref:Tyrosine-protein phosphatase n=1 Tax=Lederbergia lenta TaxID=1467 RepID=A0A2X4WYU7_LEDLE|nr:CpsB/CapC family capsule biosynthesis tyrosine phosphatase [Lederbergia lenta]MEC2323170.1 tyrosine protein phosphatase [Lederbergia lenta]SQI62880.1 protein-tyrosine-phosphatase [Lederbergia lenta]